MIQAFETGWRMIFLMRKNDFSDAEEECMAELLATMDGDE